MNIIRLHQMEFQTFHGYYQEEKLMKQKFMVNIDIQTNFMHAAIKDDLDGTINYEEVYTICAKILEQPVSLIEHIAYNIGTTIKNKFKTVKLVTVEVQKRDVQLGGKLDFVSVVLDV